MAKALDLEFRRELYATVREFPGLHVRELARQLGTSVALIEYHIPVLLESELIAIESDRYQRVFPAGTPEKNRKWLGILREEHPARIVLLLLNEGALRHGEICEQLEMGKSKATFHLKKMIAAGLVKKEGPQFYVADTKKVTQILVANRPTRAALANFASLWSNFYGN